MPPPTPPFPPTHSSRPSGSQAASGPCFSCRSAGVTGSGVGDRSSASQSPSSLAALLCSPLPICLPARRFILSIAFSRCLAISSLAPLSCGLTSWTDTGGLCWKHFKPVFSLSRLVVRRLLSQPLGLVFCLWGWGWLFLESFGKVKRGSDSDEGDLQGSQPP